MASIDLDLRLQLTGNWTQTDSEGSVGSSTVRGKGNKRKREVGQNPNSDDKSFSAAISDNLPNKGKRVMTVNHSSEFDLCSTSALEKLPISGCIPVEMDPPSTHLAFNVDKDFLSLNILVGSKARVGQDKRRPQRRPSERRDITMLQQVHCSWCQRAFVNRYALAAHSRFCIRKNEGEAGHRGQEEPVANGRNFNLNELPPEAKLSQETLMLMRRLGLL